MPREGYNLFSPSRRNVAQPFRHSVPVRRSKQNVQTKNGGALISQFNIQYVIALPEDGGDFSPLQGYSMALLHRSQLTRHILSSCPPTVLELTSFSDATLQLRLAGRSAYDICPLTVPGLGKIQIGPNEPFWIVFVDSETNESVRNWARLQQIPPLIIDVSISQNEPILSWDALTNFVLATVKTIDDCFPDTDTTMLKRITERCALRLTFKVPFPQTNHNTNIPNELTLMSCGALFDEVSTPLCSLDNAVYVKHIMQSASAVASIRHSVPDSNMFKASPPMHGLILTSPSTYRHIGKLDTKAGSLGEKRVLDAISVLSRQSTYSTQFESHKAHSMLSSEAQSVMQLRTLELHAYTDCLSVRAASFLSPVIRLPPTDSKVRLALTQLADCLRSRSPKLSTTAKLAQNVFQRTTGGIPADFMEVVNLNHSGIKIVSDAPLELATVRGIPMLMRHITSRIPTTPGNMSYILTLPHSPIDLTPADFGETLVVRSFQSGDPLARHLEVAVQAFRLSDGSCLPVRFVDVHDRKELIDAVSTFTGAILVIDCHGSHNRHSDTAVLHLQNESVNVWDLRDELKLPPIVFACACDTFAMDRSHVSTAGGLLSAGARTVIATSLPVLSGPAAIFVARLLYRVYEYLPTVTNVLRRAIRWDNVFGLMHRMMYVSEIMRLLEAQLKTDGKTELQSQITGMIHSSGSDWYETFVAKVTEAFGITHLGYEHLLRSKLPFPESFKYVQLGNPESIVIRADDADPSEFLD